MNIKMSPDFIQKQRDKGIPDEKINAFLKSKGVFSPELNQFEGRTKGRFGTEFLAEPSRNLVEGAFARLGANRGAIKSSEKARQNAINLIPKVQGLIDKKKNIGQDTSKLDKILNELNFEAQQLEQQEQYLQTGGATGKQMLASTGKTALTFAPSLIGPLGKLGSATPGLGKVGAGLTKFADFAARKPYLGAVAEGALGVGAYSGIDTAGEGGGAGDIAKSTAKGAGAGALGGPLAMFGLKTLVRPFTKPLTKAGLTPVIDGVPNQEDIQKQITKTFGISELTPNQITQELTTNNSPRLNFAQSFYNRTKDILIPNKKGKLVPFSPKNVSNDGREIMFAMQKAENSALDDLNTIYKEMGDNDWITQRAKVIERLDALKKDAGYSTQAKKFVDNIIEEIEIRKNPAGMMKYVNDNLSQYVDNFFSGATDKIQNRTAADAKFVIRDSVIDFAKTIDSNEDVLRLLKEVGGYKSVQKDIVDLVKDSLTPSQASLFDKYGLANMISGSGFGNIGQVAKGGAFNALSVMEGIFGKKQRKELLKVFKMMDNFYKGNNLKRGVPPLNTSKMQMLRTPQLAAPSPGAPKTQLPSQGTISPARGAFEDVGRSPVKMDNVMIKGAIDDVVKTRPKKDQAAVKKFLEDMLSGEEGMSKLQAILGVGGVAAGAAILNEQSEGSGEDKEGPLIIRDESGGLEKTTFKEEVARRESGGEEKPYLAVGTNDDGSKDYGKYQVGKETLDVWSERALGKKVTTDEFLNSPEMQEKFIDYIFERFVNEYEITDPELALAYWHKGWGTNLNKPDEEVKKLAADYLAK